MKILPISLILLLLTVAISYPLILRIFDFELKEFQKNIQYQDIARKQEQYDDQADRIFSRIESIRSQEDSQRKEVESLRRDYISEIEGVGNGKVGYGPIAKIKEEEYKRKLSEFNDHISENQSLIYDLRRQLDELDNRKNDKIKFLKASSGNSLLSKITALNSLESSNLSVQIMRLLILLLMFIINLFPFIAKLFSPRDVYEEELRIQQDYTIAENKAIANTNFAVLDEKLEEARESGDLDGIQDSIKSLKDKIEDSEKDLETYFSKYFTSTIDSINFELNNLNRRSSNLLVQGIVIIMIGILLYFGLIFFWLQEFHDNNFQYYHIFGIASTSLLFIFIEFLGGWFLKQHRKVAENSLFLTKSKLILDRYILIYYASKEEESESLRPDTFNSLKNLLTKDILFPDTQHNNIESSFAKEAMESISTLADTIKKMGNDSK